MSADLVFRDSCFLDFLGLKGSYSEKYLETSILVELQKFIIEMGTDFAFMARQKRISIEKNKHRFQKWLDLIRSSFTETTVKTLKLGIKKPPLPFSHTPLLKVLIPTFWFLPTVDSCQAMAGLLSQRQNKFYHEYQE